jgi:hypothetical protein
MAECGVGATAGTVRRAKVHRCYPVFADALCPIFLSFSALLRILRSLQRQNVELALRPGLCAGRKRIPRRVLLLPDRSSSSRPRWLNAGLYFLSVSFLRESMSRYNSTRLYSNCIYYVVYTAQYVYLSPCRHRD